MPAPSTGSEANVATLISMFANADVVLADGTTIRGKLDQRTTEVPTETGMQIRAYTVLDLHATTLGTLAEGQTLTIKGVSYFVSSMNEDFEGWVRCVLSRA